MFENFRSSKTFKIINGIATSAILALLLSFAFFGYDLYKDIKRDQKNKENLGIITQTLDGITLSLSTKYLGTFPGYLEETLRVFEHLEENDTVIIFEDVLYYGIKSKPEEFRRFNQFLINHARHGGKVVIAYYDNHSQTIATNVFRNMIKEGRIDLQYLSVIQMEIEQGMEHAKNKNRALAIQLDSVITEKYFQQSVLKDTSAAEKVRKEYLDKALVANLKQLEKSGFDIVISRLCVDLDSIKQHYLGGGKSFDDIRFADYEHMYSDMTDCIAECYLYHGIELIPLNEYLTMSCWMIKPANSNRRSEAILAFPSKYASDEIGFYSQDSSFEKYITAMLSGVRRSQKANERHKERLKNHKDEIELQ